MDSPKNYKKNWELLRKESLLGLKAKLFQKDLLLDPKAKGFILKEKPFQKDSLLDSEASLL